MFKLSPKENDFISQLYDKQRDMLLNYALSKLYDEDMAEETVQETFRIACNRIQTVMENENPAGWLVRTLQNTIKKAIHSKQQAAMYIAELPDDFDIENIADDKPFDEDVDLLHSDLVSNKDFQLFKQYVLEGKSIKEIALENKISFDTCKHRIARAKKRLSKLIDI